MTPRVTTKDEDGGNLHSWFFWPLITGHRPLFSWEHLRTAGAALGCLVTNLGDKFHCRRLGHLRWIAVGIILGGPRGRRHLGDKQGPAL